jgi:hypothetical protein
MLPRIHRLIVTSSLVVSLLLLADDVTAGRTDRVAVNAAKVNEFNAGFSSKTISIRVIFSRFMSAG